MTREEAIKVLKAIRVYNCYPKSAGEETKEAIDTAIEALSERNIARDIATILENEQDMRVILQNADRQTLDEIVRCKDCKHWTEEKDEEDDILYGWCRAPFENDNLLVYGDDATRIFTAYDFFCKSGERREP